jgi:hypothetical protein
VDYGKKFCDPKNLEKLMEIRGEKIKAVMDKILKKKKNNKIKRKKRHEK